MSSYHALTAAELETLEQIAATPMPASLRRMNRLARLLWLGLAIETMSGITATDAGRRMLAQVRPAAEAVPTRLAS